MKPATMILFLATSLSSFAFASQSAVCTVSISQSGVTCTRTIAISFVDDSVNRLKITGATKCDNEPGDSASVSGELSLNSEYGKILDPSGKFNYYSGTVNTVTPPDQKSEPTKFMLGLSSEITAQSLARASATQKIGTVQDLQMGEGSCIAQ